MSKIKNYYWDEICAMADDIDKSDNELLKEDEENYLNFVRSTMETIETTEPIFTTEIISRHGELISNTAFTSEQEANMIKDIIFKIDPTSIVNIRSRHVKATAAKDICDYINSENTEYNVPEKQFKPSIIKKLNPFSK